MQFKLRTTCLKIKRWKTLWFILNKCVFNSLRYFMLIFFLDNCKNHCFTIWCIQYLQLNLDCKLAGSKPFNWFENAIKLSIKQFVHLNKTFTFSLDILMHLYIYNVASRKYQIKLTIFCSKCPLKNTFSAFCLFVLRINRHIHFKIFWVFAFKICMRICTILK